MVGVPSHVPRSAVSVAPSRAVPEIAGATMLAGGAAATVSVACDAALVLPPALLAATTIRIVAPTSPGVRA